MTTYVARSTLITGAGTRPHRVVLYTRDHAFHPYVVHYQLESDGSRWQGTYTDSLAAASKEFDRRCLACGVTDERVKAGDTPRRLMALG